MRVLLQVQSGSGERVRLWPHVRAAAYRGLDAATATTRGLRDRTEIAMIPGVEILP